jgi:hypothetical protein
MNVNKGEVSLSAGRQSLFAAAVAILFLAATLPVASVFRGAERNFDERRCYFPNVEAMAAKFPKVDLMADSMTSSPPGYFHLLGGMTRVTGASTPLIRFNHVLLSLVGVLFCFALLGRFACRGAWSFLPFFPLFLGTYYLKQSCLISTDNVGLWLSVAVLTLLFFAPKTVACSFAAGALAVLAVYCRQTSIWLVAPLGAPLFLRLLGIGKRDERWNYEMAAAVGGFVCLCLLAVLYLTWGGLLPEKWRGAHHGWSLTAPLYAVSLFGLLATFFLPFKDAAQRQGLRPALLTAILLGSLLFLLAPSSFDSKQGRWGGVLWVVARLTPEVAERALVFLPLAILGCFAITVATQRLWQASPSRAAAWFLALVAWVTSTVPNSHIFHRYFEGYVLLFLGFVAVLATPDTKTARGKIYALTAALFGFGVASLYFTDNGFRSGPILNWPF